MFINWCIPDIPRTLQLKMNKERRFLEEIILQRETRMCSKTRGSDNFSFYESLERNRQTKPDNHSKSNVEEKIEMKSFAAKTNLEDNFEEIDLGLPEPIAKPDENTTVNNMQELLFRKTEGIYPEDIRMTIRESNMTDLTATLNEISVLVEELNDSK